MDLSIIIPVYNTPKEILERCFSTINFSAKINYEVIIVDDGSRKEIGEYCENYTKEQSKYRYIRQINKGVSAARNVGIRYAKGEYILFLDADDELITENINEEYLKGKWDVVIFDLEKHSKNSIVQMRVFDQMPESNPHKKDFVSMACKGRMNSACGRLLRRSMLIDKDINFDEEMILGEDALFMLKTIVNADSLCYGTKPIYRYNYTFTSGNKRLMCFPEKAYLNLVCLYRQRMAVLNDNSLWERSCQTDSGCERAVINESLVKALFEISGVLQVNGLDYSKCRNRFVYILVEMPQEDLIQFSIISKIKYALLKYDLKILIGILGLLRELHVRIKR